MDGKREGGRRREERKKRSNGERAVCNEQNVRLVRDTYRILLLYEINEGFDRSVLREKMEGNRSASSSTFLPSLVFSSPTPTSGRLRVLLTGGFDHRNQPVTPMLKKREEVRRGESSDG